MTWTTQPRSKFNDLAYIETGLGPLVILVHGVGLRAEAWGAQAKALSRTHHIVAVDMPGHGESEALDEKPSLTAFTDKIAQFLTEPAVVIGHSFGAMIALDMAARYPERLRGAAALNAIYRRSAQAKVAVEARAQALDGKTMADPTGTLDRWFATDETDEKIACDRWLRTVNPIGYRTAYRVFATEDGPSDAALAAIQCPTLFMTGENEPNSTPQMSIDMANRTPKGEAMIIPNAAHMMPMTHANSVNAALATFINKAHL